MEVPRGNLSRVNNTVLPLYDVPRGDVCSDNLLDFPCRGAIKKSTRFCPKRVGSFGYNTLASEEKASEK